jgi:intracellular septation protein A
MHFEVPRLTAIVRHALPHVLEGVVVPLVLFAVALEMLGVMAAVVVGLAWAYVALLRRIVLRRAVPGMLLLGAAALTAKSALTLLTGSTLVYFLQPTVGSALVGLAFLASVFFGAPLAGRLARDFCPIPDEVFGGRHLQRFFAQISLLWAVAQFAVAGLGGWLVFTQSPGVIALARPAASWGITGLGIALSVAWFWRSGASHGVVRAVA